MKSFSVQDEGVKRASGIKALLIEVGVIAALVVVMVFVLDYFKVISLASFFSQKSVNETVNQKSETNAYPTTNPEQKTAQVAQQALKKMMRTNALHYSVVDTEFEGTLSRIDFEGGFISERNEKYKVLVVVSLGNTQELFPTYFPEVAMGKIKVFDKIEDKNNPITLNDLRSGDKLIIKTSKDLIEPYPNNLIEAIITRVN